MIGKNVSPGVYGGAAALSGGTAFGATDIDSATGKPVAAACVTFPG